MSVEGVKVRESAALDWRKIHVIDIDTGVTKEQETDSWIWSGAGLTEFADRFALIARHLTKSEWGGAGGILLEDD